MLILDLPPQLQERVVCSISAFVKHEVPANIVLAIAEKEGGHPVSTDSVQMRAVSRPAAQTVATSYVPREHIINGHP
jgi:hypothetical protein